MSVTRMMIVQIFSLLMLSNVVTIEAAMAKVEKVEMEMEVSTMAKMEMEAKALLKMEWAEPLSNVLQRATKASKTMHMSEAFKAVGHKMSHEISGFLQGHNKTKEVHPISLAG